MVVSFGRALSATLAGAPWTADLGRSAIAVALLFGPTVGFACACGCGVFDVGTATMLPTGPGGVVYLEDDYMDQNQNWVGSHSAPASANTDKELETNFGGVGFDYQFNNAWGVSVKVPYWDRIFRTDTGTPTVPDVVTYRHSALGRYRVLGSLHGLLIRPVDRSSRSV